VVNTQSIEELAETVRDGLDRDHHVAQGLLMAARDMFREPNFYGVGGPAADQFWRHFNPHRILADVAARRTLLDEALGWEHKRHSTSPYLSCIAETLLIGGRLRLRAEDENRDAPCDCNRDTRVRAVLTALAAPYQEAS
jgi:hypothetical protein